jgi:tight adherence protein C
MFDNPETVIITLTSLGAFAVVLIAVLPFLARDQRSDRMKTVSQHRSGLVQMQRDELAKLTQLRKTRTAQVDIIKNLLERFKLENMTASKDLKNKLTAAGWRHQSAPVMFVASRLVCAVIAAFGVFIFLSVSQKFSYPLMIQFLLAGGAGGGGFFLPDLLVRNAMQNRQHVIGRGFPDALDLLVICVEAGLSIEGAFARVTEEIADGSPVLSQEFGLTSAELAYLGDRGKAYANLADRTGLPAAKALATALIQSEKYGTPVSTALKVLAQESRDDRMAKAEKKAGALPAQLTVPMIVFFLPALFLVIIGPAIIRVLHLD